MNETKTTTLRTFFAIDFDQTTRDFCAKVIKKLHNTHKSKQLRWTPLENLHLTLRFLGQIETGTIQAITADLQTALNEFNAFRLQFAKIDLFPNHEHPHTFVILPQQTPELFNLVAAIEPVVNAHSIHKQRRIYRPHITLARINGQFNLMPVTIDLQDAPCINVDNIVLMHSQTHPEGAVYEVMQRIELGNH